MSINSTDKNHKSLIILERLEKVLSRVQEQIIFADAKTGFLITLLSILIGFIFVNYKEFMQVTPKILNTILLVLFIISTAISMICCFVIILSRFRNNTPISKIFFQDILEVYKDDYNKYANDIRALSNEDWIKQISFQIIELSKIASIKHKNFQTGIIACAFSFACTFVIIILKGVNHFF